MHLSGSTVGRVLLELGDGEIHSGESLGGRLAVSRAAIGKAVESLRRYGLAVESIPGRGYRVPGGYEPLDRAAITAYCTEGGVAAPPLEVRFVIPSTHDALPSARIPGGADASSAAAVFAEGQTGGRGRRGRLWASPLGGVYLSVAWGFPVLEETLAPLGMAVAVEVAATLQDCDVDLAVKWPNDLLFCGGKVGGILTEVYGEPTGPCRAKVGVGINLGSAPQLPDEAGFPAAALPLTRLSRNRLAGGLLNSVVRALGTFQRNGFAPAAALWERFDALAGRPVTLHVSDKEIEGIAQGIDEIGRLRILREGEEERFACGETRLRKRS